MNRLVSLFLRLLNVPDHGPEPAPGAEVVAVLQPSEALFKKQLAIWFVTELGGLLFMTALILTTNLFFVPDFLEDWLRVGLQPNFWEQFFDEVPSWMVTLRNLNPFDGIPNLVIYGYALQAMYSLFKIHMKLEMRTHWFVVDERGIRTRRGLFTIQDKNADFSRIQSLRLKASLIQGVFGLADIELHTASAASQMDNKEKTTMAFRNIANGQAVFDQIQELLLANLNEKAKQEAKEFEEAPEVTAAKVLLHEARSLRAAYG